MRLHRRRQLVQVIDHEHEAVTIATSSITRIWRGRVTTFTLKLLGMNLTINGSAVKLKTRPLNAPAAA